MTQKSAEHFAEQFAEHFAALPVRPPHEKVCADSVWLLAEVKQTAITRPSKSSTIEPNSLGQNLSETATET